MRRSLESIALLAFLLTVWITYSAFYGSEHLPARIPVHFDAAGNVNGWGSPTSLLLLPVISLISYLALTVAARFPASFNYPVKVTAENVARLQGITRDMLAWMKTELVCLFGVLQWAIIRSARGGQGHMSPWLVPPFIVLLFATVGWYMVAMFRASFAGGKNKTPGGA